MKKYFCDLCSTEVPTSEIVGFFLKSGDTSPVLHIRVSILGMDGIVCSDCALRALKYCVEENTEKEK